MNKLLKMSKKKFYVIYIIFDMFFVGVGMGVPFFCILLGFPVGWYIAKQKSLNQKDISTILNEILKYSLYTALFTFILMLCIWVPLSTMLLNPGADFVNTGIPMILYDPKMSFIGWMILMIFISPFLQLLATVFASNVALWRLFKKDDSIDG